MNIIIVDGLIKILFPTGSMWREWQQDKVIFAIYKTPNSLTDVDTKVDIIGKSNKKVWSMWMEGQMRMNDCWYTIQDTK